MSSQGQKRQREDPPASRVGSHICNLIWTPGRQATIFHISHDIWKIILEKQDLATLWSISRTCLFLYEDANFLMVSIARKTLPGLRLDLADKDVRRAYLILQGKACFANTDWSGNSTVKARLKDTFMLPDSVIKRLPSRKERANVWYDTSVVITAALNHHMSFSTINKKRKDMENKRREKEEAKEAIEKVAKKIKQDALEKEKRLREEELRLHELKCQKNREERDRRFSLMETALLGMGFKGWHNVRPAIQGFKYEIENSVLQWMHNFREQSGIVEEFVSMLRVLCQGILERGSWDFLERIVTPEGLYYRLFTVSQVLTESGRYVFVVPGSQEMIVKQVCKKSFYVECDSDKVSDEMIRERVRTLMKLE